MASKIFGGANLSDIARSTRERPEGFATGTEKVNPGRPVMAAAELALTGRVVPALERENIFSVDPRRCRPWAHHNRGAVWYTRDRCQDLIESIAKDGQQEPAVARKLVGDPSFDYELIYGMRRRFACEFLNAKLKLRVMDPVTFDVPPDLGRYSRSKVMEAAEKIRADLQQTVYDLLSERRSVWFG